MTPTTRRPPLPALTGLRAVAAVWVVLFHYRDDLLALVPGLAPLDTFMRAGYLGVDLFFPLSGFVLAYTYADRLGSFSWRASADFVRNRFARVWPVHVLTLNLDLAVAALVGTLGVGADGHRRTPAGVRRERRDGAHLVQRPAELQRPGVVDQLGVVRLPARTAALRARRCGCVGRAPALAAGSGRRMPRCSPSSRRWRCPTATSSTCSTCGSWASSSAGCCSASPGCAAGPGSAASSWCCPLTLVVLALVPAASAGHYWAAPALGLGVAGSRGVERLGHLGAVLAARRRSGGGVVRAVHDPPARAAVRALAAGVGAGVRVGVPPSWSSGSCVVLVGIAWLVHVGGRATGPAAAPGAPSGAAGGGRRPSRPSSWSAPVRRSPWSDTCEVAHNFRRVCAKTASREPPSRYVDLASTGTVAPPCSNSSIGRTRGPRTGSSR